MQSKLLCVALFMASLFICSGAWAQTKLVKGKVQDESGGPLPKASILVKGTNTGTSSGDDGSFELMVPANATLVITAIGYNKTEVKTSAKDFVTISLLPDNRSLNEVVVTALGVKREKRNLTFSSQEIKADELVKAKDKGR
jgi:hypothetical protein